MVFSPDSKPLFKTTGEDAEEAVAAILEMALLRCQDQLKADEGKEDDWI